MLEIWLSFSAGLAGSGHCLGMCGGIVSALALSRRDLAAPQRLLFNSLYHAGRITTYSLLGLVVGFVAQTEKLDAFKPLLKWLFLGANVLVVVIGIFTILGVRALGIAAFDGSGSAIMRTLFSRLSASSSLFTALPTGLLMGFLPCGLVYGVLISAATSGSALKGMSMLLAFGFGTLPLLLVYGQVASTISSLRHGFFQYAVGGVVILLGLLGVWKAAMKFGCC